MRGERLAVYSRWTAASLRALHWAWKSALARQIGDATICRIWKCRGIIAVTGRQWHDSITIGTTCYAKWSVFENEELKKNTTGELRNLFIRIFLTPRICNLTLLLISTLCRLSLTLHCVVVLLQICSAIFIRFCLMTCNIVLTLWFCKVVDFSILTIQHRDQQQN